MLLNKLKNKTLLIVEDDTYSYELLVEYLLTTGANIIHAETGIDAINILKNTPGIDLILMDIKLPYKSGLKATQEIRQLNKTIPIIAQTASVSYCEIQSYLSAGMNDVIPKPYKQNELINIVLKYF